MLTLTTGVWKCPPPRYRTGINTVCASDPGLLTWVGKSVCCSTIPLSLTSSSSAAVVLSCSRVLTRFSWRFFRSEWEQCINDSVIVVSNVALSVGKLCQGLQRTFLSHKVCLSRCCWDFWHPFWPPFFFVGANCLAVALDTCLVFQKFCTLRQEENDQSGQNPLTVDEWRLRDSWTCIWHRCFRSGWRSVCLTN